MTSSYELWVDKVKTPGMRATYTWKVFLDGILLTGGDSYYKWNAQRAAKRAAKRHAQGRNNKTNVWYKTLEL